MKKLVLFASGSGSNAENIIRYFDKNNLAKVVAVFTNNANAVLVQKAQNLSIPVEVISRDELFKGSILGKVNGYEPDLIVLAGFLLMFPSDVIAAYPGKVINIHPALLPKYGGKGMYGMNVHSAILANGDKETGISIHHVNDKYDEGALIFQHAVKINDCATPQEIAAKVQLLEHEHFPAVIQKLLES